MQDVNGKAQGSKQFFDGFLQTLKLHHIHSKCYHPPTFNGATTMIAQRNFYKYMFWVTNTLWRINILSCYKYLIWIHSCFQAWLHEHFEHARFHYWKSLQASLKSKKELVKEGEEDIPLENRIELTFLNLLCLVSIVDHCHFNELTINCVASHYSLLLE